VKLISFKSEVKGRVSDIDGESKGGDCNEVMHAG